MKNFINIKMQTNISSEKIDKIDVEDLIKDFRVVNIDAFSAYLKEVWRVNIVLVNNKGFGAKKR